MDFTDIPTTLQALVAIYDNANSLHTNAYDEAITTPTEESVRRALAIQMIITKEWGLAVNENPLQGAFVVDELTERLRVRVQPRQPSQRRRNVAAATRLLEVEQDHRGHRVLVDAVDGIGLDDRPVAGVVVPPPLALLTL